MASPYATSEDSALLWYEQSINAAVCIGAMACGVHLAACYWSTRSAFKSKENHAYLWLALSAVMFIVTTINICCSVNFNERAWIDDRNYPGGPLAFFAEQQSIHVNVASISTSVIALFLADTLLIYRCHCLWRKTYMTLFLCIVLLSSTVMSILHCVQATRSSSDAWDQSTLSLSVPYASLSMSLNVLLVITLICRLLDLRRKLPSTLDDQIKAAYTTFEVIAVESALPYGLASLLFVVLYGLRNTGANLFLSLLVQLEGIVSQLIISRIVNGNAWSMDILRQIGPQTLVFRGQLGRGTNVQTSTDLSMAILSEADRHSAADTKGVATDV